MSGVDDVAVAALLSPFGVELAVSMFFSPLTSAHRRAGEDRWGTRQFGARAIPTRPRLTGR